MTSLRVLLQRTAAVVKRVAGMPDYAAYVTHIRAAHPEHAIPTEREYYASYVDAKYRAGGSRCC